MSTQGKTTDLKVFLDQAPDGIILINSTGDILMINSQAEVLFGYSNNELKGKTLNTLIPHRYHANHNKHIEGYITKPAYRGMGRVDTELFGLKKDGTEFPVDISLGGVTLGGKKVAVASIRDITERKKAKKLLRESEEKYRTLIEGSHELIQTVDINGNLQFVNTAWKNILGYTDEEIENLKVFDIIADESKEVCSSEFIRIMQGETIKNVEAVFKAKNGKKKYVEGTSIPKFEDGKVVGTQGFFRDVTEKKKAKDELIRMQANLEALFKGSEIGYLLLDTEINTISFNTILSNWLSDETGVELNVGTNFILLFEGDRYNRLKKAFSQALKGEKIEYEINGKEENTKETNWYYLSINPVKQLDNEVIGLSLTCLNITSRKKTELELNKITSDIIQRNKDLEQFTYIISHNLRAPLANILGLTDMMKMDDLKKEEQHFLLNGLYNSVEKLDEVVQDLNHILQIKRDISEKKQKVIFSSLIDDIKLSVSHLLIRENVELNTNFDEINETFIIRSYLYSILYNLITNSIKYRQPHISPKIQIKSLIIPNGFSLVVKDNGVGIDLEKHKDKVFGLYKRFHTDIEGKGVGLFMVKTQVESLGGKITIASKVNEGTEFTLTFTDTKN